MGEIAEQMIEDKKLLKEFKNRKYEKPVVVWESE